MRKPAHRILLLLTAASLACGISVAFAQTAIPGNSQDSFDNFRPIDYQRLLETALVAIESGEFESARQSISDSLQIIKVNHGLLSVEQFPALQLITQTAIAQHDWLALDQHLAYFEWLLGKLEPTAIESYLSGAEILNNLYLRAAADSNNPQNAHYLIAAKQLNWRAVTAMEQSFGKTSLRLAPWLYDIVLTHYYQTALTRRKGMTSYDYKSTTPVIVSGWSLSKNESLEQSYSIGQELLQRIRALYADSTAASASTDAQILLLIADWELLFGKGSSAEALYRTAYASLQQANVDKETLLAWFAQPLIIPQREFIATGPVPPQPSNATLNLIAWSAVFPGTLQPPGLAGNLPLPAAKFSATARLNLVSNNVSTLSSNAIAPNVFSYGISNLSIESMTPDNEPVASMARSQIAELQFRPLLIDATVTAASDIRLHYVFAADTDFSMLTDAK